MAPGSKRARHMPRRRSHGGAQSFVLYVHIAFLTPFFKLHMTACGCSQQNAFRRGDYGRIERVRAGGGSLLVGPATAALRRQRKGRLQPQGVPRGAALGHNRARAHALPEALPACAVRYLCVATFTIRPFSLNRV